MKIKGRESKKDFDFKREMMALKCALLLLSEPLEGETLTVLGHRVMHYFLLYLY